MGQTRISKEHSFNIKQLRNAYALNTPIIIWQKDGNRKISCQAFFYEMFPESNRIFLRPLNRQLKFSPDKPLFVKIHTPSLLFKTKILPAYRNFLVISIPSSIFVEENRRFMRKHSLPNATNNIVVRKYSHLKKPSAKINLELQDLSSKGAGIVGPASKVMLLHPNEFVLLEEINGHKLKEPLIGKIIYITRLTTKGKNLIQSSVVRTGIKLISKQKQETTA